MAWKKPFGREGIVSAFEALIEDGIIPRDLDISQITVEPPREQGYGHVATNAAMLLSKQAGMKPLDLAEHIISKLRLDPQVVKLDIAGPGFINISLSNEVWHRELTNVLCAGITYGDSNMGQGEAVNVEFVSANPTGPLHVGHGRGAVFGDALSALLEKTGYKVTREYWINDAGGQVNTLARSFHFRYLEVLGENNGKIPEGLYPGKYLIGPAQALVKQEGDYWQNKSEDEWLEPFRNFAIAAMMDLIKTDLSRLGIKMDVFTSEVQMVNSGKVQECLEYLEDRNLIYTGILEPPKGRRAEDWEPRPQILFKATEFGDDVDRPLKKSDGSWTYFSTDIAYHLDKYQRGFKTMINAWGADHGGYVKRMQAAVKALTNGNGDLDIRLCQMINLLENGKQLKMSKRSGNFITMDDVNKQVGKDVFRFIMLTRKNDAQLDFDLQQVKEQSKDNPVFYVQYAHARVSSVFRHAADIFSSDELTTDTLANAPISKLTDSAEISLIIQIARWPRLVESAALAHEPHRIAFFLYDLASSFHGLWNMGKDNMELRFIKTEDKDLTLARLALIRGVALVIASGLRIFGVEPKEEMR